MFGLCPQPQVLEDLLVVGREAVAGLEISGLRLSPMLRQDSIVAIGKSLQLDLSRQLLVTRIQFWYSNQRMLLELAGRWFSHQLRDLDGLIQRKHRLILVNGLFEMLLLEGVSLVLLDDAI